MNKIIKFIPIIFIGGLLFGGSCTKKDETPAPQNSSSEYYFKGSFGSETLNFEDKIMFMGGNSWYNTGYGGGGMTHINKTNEYIYILGCNSFWQNQNQPNSLLDMNFQKIKFNVGANYKPSEKDQYDLLESGSIKYIKSYSVEGNSNGWNVSQGWNIMYTDESGKRWSIGESSKGYITIVKKENVFTNGKELKVTGNIICQLQEDNNPSNVKTLKGTFSQIMSNYYENPVVTELD